MATDEFIICGYSKMDRMVEVTDLAPTISSLFQFPV
jgi:hypothetical protein